jgi:hypothetical protein
MTVQSKSWEQVGKKFEAIGTQLRRRFDEASEDAGADRAAFEKALQALLSSIEDTFEAAGKAARDPVLRKELTELAASVREALLATFEGVREQLAATRRSLSAVQGKRSPALRSTAHKTTAGKATGAKAAPRRTASRAPAASKGPSA